MVRAGYKQTEVGVIPEDWEVKSISSVMQLINGYAFNPKDWVTQGTPIIRIQNLNDCDAEFNYFSGTIDQRYRVVKGDILFAWSGTKGTSFGARIWSGAEALLNQHIFKVLPDKNKIIPAYAYLALRKIQEDIEKLAHGFKASFVHVKKSDISSTYLAIPSIIEQTAIATALSDIDALITILTELIDKKRQIKTATMQQLLTGKQRLAGFGDGKGMKSTELGEIPEDWGIVKIKEVATIDPENLSSSTNLDYEFSYISLENVEHGKLLGTLNYIFKESPSRARRVIRKNDVLISTVRPNLMSHLFINCEVKNTICSTGFSVIRCNKQGIPQYLYQLFFSSIVNTQINNLISGSNYPAISSQNVKNLQIPLPPTPEQQAIAQVLSDMDDDLNALETHLTKTKAIKQGMMQELLTGRTRLI